MIRNAGKLNPYAFSFDVSNLRSRQSNTFVRSVSKPPKTLPLSTDHLHFLTLPEGNVEYYILFENCIVDLKKG